jgi:ribosomal protein RSM22 (predicted rRNA methylase)
VLDEVLRPIRKPELSTKDLARLGPAIKTLSLAYNTAQAEGQRTKLPVEARIAFSFPRDVPKGAGAVRELVASGALTIPADRPLRVLDLGAGLGAMTWGLVRALEASGAAGTVEALLVDEDEEVLQKAVAIARAAQKEEGRVRLVLTTERRNVVKDRSFRPYDVVILGQVLSEIDPRAEAASRVESHAALLGDLLEKAVLPDGSLVVVEPALRDRARHLHAVRDRLLERAVGSVFAPCLHARPCPMLPIEGEWCHEDLPIDLPTWVVPLARAAGLRWQGLTFSYLVLRRDGKTLVDRLPAGPNVRFRAVSDLLRSKGKAELFVCGEDGERRRIRRLDRDVASETGVPFDDLRRGDIVTLSSKDGAAIDAGGRVAVGTHAAIDVAASRK